EKSIKKQSDTLGAVIQRFADGAAASDDLRRAMDSIRLSAMPTADELGALQVRSAGLDQALASLAKSGHAIDAAYVFNQIAQKASDAHISEAQLTSIFPQYTAAARTANTATSGLATASDNAAGAVKRQRDALATPGGLIDALHRLNSASNANALSELDWRDKLVQVTQTIKDNKGALSKKTQAGRDDRRAVIEAANAVLQHTQELKDQKAPLSTINSYLGTHRQQLINAAVQAGLTRAKATQLVNEYLKVPKKVSTAIEQPGMRKKFLDAIAYDKRLRSMPPYVSTVVDVKLRAQMAVVGKVGQARQGPGNFAKGGLAPAGWALVGEEGPELVRFTDSARVYTAAQTKRALADADRLGLDGAGLAKRIGFARGGIASVQSFIRSTDPLPYVWGGAGPGSYDCSGLLGAVYGKLTGRGGGHGQRYFTTANERGYFAPGFVPGGFNVGLRPGVHTAGNLAGLAFEAASPSRGIRVGGAASPVSSFPVQLHLAGLQALSQAQMLQALRQVAPVMLARYSKYVRTGHFDQGGTLPPGMTLAYNGTGRGETVLPNGRIRLDRADMQYLATEIARSLPLGESAGHAATRYGRGG
ncbi:MAG TPA: hypothetical protein VIV12_28385, partial [Streptosporangiaceae bacterium]